MRVLVTGASGKLGGEVLRQLLQHGCDAHGVDIHPSPHADLPPVTIVDLRNLPAIRAAVQGSDVVFHAGNLPTLGGTTESFCDGFANNVSGTFNLIESCRAERVAHIVYASSIHVYGCMAHGLHRPDGRYAYTAPVYVPVDEAHPRTPAQPYAMSKKLCEELGEAFLAAGAIRSFISLRYTGLMKEIGTPKMFLHTLAGSLLSYVLLTEAARATVLAIQAVHAGKISGFTAYNVTARKPRFQWTEELFLRTYSQLPEFRHGIGSTDGLFDVRAIERDLGWFSDGVEPLAIPPGSTSHPSQSAAPIKVPV